MSPRPIPNLVSTIIPVYNRPQLLREAVESVLAQTHRPIEVVIVDDGSDDETPKVASELATGWPEVRYVRQNNEGPGPARNRGLAEANGEFVQFLDSDDLLLPEKFSRQIEDLRRHPECGLSYCIASRPDLPGGGPYSHRTAEAIQHILPTTLDHRVWPTLSPLWRREACDRIGPWGPYRVWEDWEYDCRAGILDIRPIHTPAVLCQVRDHVEARASGSPRGYTQAQWADFLAAQEAIVSRLEQAGQLHHLKASLFARNIFRVARTCGLEGYHDEARRAYLLAHRVTHGPVECSKLAVFRSLSLVVGWRRAASLLEWSRQAIRRVPARPREEH